eukprot:s5348_g4.t1
MYVLGSLSVKRKDVIVRGYLYSLSAGSENSSWGQYPHEAFGRGPMTPTIEAVGLMFRSWHVVYGQFPHVHCLLRHCVRFGVVLEDFPIGDPARQNRSCQRDDFSLADRQLGRVCWVAEFESAMVHGVEGALILILSASRRRECQFLERNFTNAYRRCDVWHERREAVHQAQIRAEDARYEATVKLAERDVEVKKRVGRMRDMAKVKFSRQWIERRSRWLRGHAMASKTNDAFKATLANKQNNAEDCRHVPERKYAFGSRASRREQRRKDVVQRLTAFADEAEAASLRMREAAGTPKAPFLQ